MSRKDNPPFPRGSTLGVSTTSDGTNIEGKIWEFEDISPTTGIMRSNATVTCRAVRNVCGAAQFPSQTGNTTTMLAKRLVTYQAGTIARVDGYACLDNQPDAFPVDEYLPTGIPQYDIGWIVIDGPAICRTAASSLVAITNSNTVTNIVAAIMAATSGATTAGRVSSLTTAATSGPALLGAAFGKLGTALSTMTANQTDSDVLVVIKKLS